MRADSDRAIYRFFYAHIVHGLLIKWASGEHVTLDFKKTMVRLDLEDDKDLVVYYWVGAREGFQSLLQMFD